MVIPCLFWLVNITDQSFITPENYLLDKKNATRDEGLQKNEPRSPSFFHIIRIATGWHSQIILGFYSNLFILPVNKRGT